jgi:hypothetical protein
MFKVIKILFIALLLHSVAMGITCSWTTFSSVNRPTADCTLYAANSVWNVRIPANPKLNPNSAAIVNTFVNWSPGNTFRTLYTLSSQFVDSHPYFFSTNGDPGYTITASSCPSGRELIPPGTVVHIPTVARPAGGVDGHLAIIDQTAGKEYDFYEFPRGGISGGGNLPNNNSGCSWGDLNGPGIARGVRTGANTFNTTEGWFANFAGEIRGDELAAGVINHALFVVTPCTNGDLGVYPGDTNNGPWFPCSNLGQSNTNAPSGGALLWLDYTDAQIAASGWPTWQKAIATAVAHYGAYVGDNGGGPNFQFAADETYSVYGQTSPVVGVAQAAGIGFISANQSYPFNPSAIDWAHHLHVVDPCVPLGLTGQNGGCVIGTAPAAPTGLSTVVH